MGKTEMDCWGSEWNGNDRLVGHHITWNSLDPSPTIGDKKFTYSINNVH